MSEEIAEPTTEERLERLREKREQRAKGRQDEVDRLTLKYEEELGAEGQAFAIVDIASLPGPIVITRVPAVVSKRFQDSIAGDKPNTFVKSLEYTLPAVVHPEKEAYKAWCKDADLAVFEVAMDLSRLHGAANRSKSAKP
jgi:hypothetical protein